MANTKILIDNTLGYQEIIQVGDGGGYFDLSKVLWDERIDGPLDVAGVNAQIGGWTRAGKSLAFDALKKSASDAALAAIQTANDSKAAAVSSRKSVMKAVQSANTAAELKAVLVAIIQHLGFDQ